MAERNSEGKATLVVVGLAVLAGLATVGAELLGAGLLDQWPLAVTIVGILLSASKVVGDYTRSRPAKHHAMADAVRAAAGLPSSAP